MRRSYYFILSILVFFMSFIVDISPVNAEPTHKFSVKIIDWDPFYNEWEGTGTGAELPANSNLEPGKIYQVSIYYVPGDTTVHSLQTYLRYDKEIFEPVLDGGTLYVETGSTNNGYAYPPKGNSPALKTQPLMTVLTNNATDYSLISMTSENTTNSTTITSEGMLLSVWFKVKEDAPPGAVAKFDIVKSENINGRLIETVVSDPNNAYNNLPVSVDSITMNIPGSPITAQKTTLKSLAVKNGGTTYTLSPAFVADSDATHTFKVIVPNQIETVDVEATATDPLAGVASGTGPQQLHVGNNEVSLIVQADDGGEDTYTLNIYRLNNDATLSSLSLSNDVNIGAFTPQNQTYTAVVPYATTSTIITATPTDSKASVTNDGSWNFTNTGATINSRVVTVNAENCKSDYQSVPGNACTSLPYTINVTRTAASTNANLSDLTVDGTTVTGFDPGTTSYTLSDVSNETTSITINATVQDTGKATIDTQLGSKALTVGDNAIDIVVRAEDGSTTKTYTINVRRLSNNSKLKTLTITPKDSGGQVVSGESWQPPFDPSSTGPYTLTVPSDTATVDVAADVDNQNNASIISGTGNGIDIKTTNPINILVQAEDGTQSTYVVNIVREKSNNAKLATLSIGGYTLTPSPFDPDVNSYTANVAGNVDKVTVSATAQDASSSITVNGQPISTGSEVSLNVGPNTIKVEVKAEDGSTNVYTIEVTRAQKTESALTDLQVDGVTVPNFREDDLGPYTLPAVGEYPLSKNDVTISATKKDSDSTINAADLGTKSLIPGENTFTVTVTAQDGQTQSTYTIKIKKQLDNDSSLSDLKINGQTIDGFSSETLSYGYEVENEITSFVLGSQDVTDSSLLIEPIKSSSYAQSVIVSNNTGFTTSGETVVDITVTAQDGTFTIYKIHVTRKKSTNNYLSSITSTVGSINEPFNKLTDSYTIDVPRETTSVTISGTTEDPAAQIVSVTGPSSLSLGDGNVFTIKVLSEYELSQANQESLGRTYTVTVNRMKSNNAFLSSLTVDGVSVPDFNKEKETYDVTVGSEKTQITVNGATEDTHATTNDFHDYNISTGSKAITVTVTAEDGTTTKTYTINVTKPASTDATLNNLYIVQTSIDPTFSPGVTSYTANVPYNVTNIDIVAEKKAGQTVTGDGNQQLNTGPNSFDIKVTPESGNPITYTIVVTREKNNNAYLNDITLSDGASLDTPFAYNTFAYNVSVANNIDKLTISATKQDPNATVTIDGSVVPDLGQQVSLNTGTNTISLLVTAEDGTTTQTYTLTIERAKSNDATLKNLVIDGVTKMEPQFAPETTEYTIEVPYEVENLSISKAEPTYKDATVDLPDDLTLNVGPNQKTITVTAEDGTVNYYTLNITRLASANNFLSSLSVKDTAQTEYITSFSKTTVKYSITVENNVDSVTIAATKEAPESTWDDSDLGLQQLNVGLNTFTITVTSNSHIDRTYTIEITRKSNSNNFLDTLSIKDENQKEYINNFVKTTDAYNFSVTEDITKLKVVATAEAETSTITINGEPVTDGGNEIILSTGSNTINIVVTPESGSTDAKTYVITVNKPASTNNYLKSLTVSPGTLTPEFNREIERYTVEVENETASIEINAEPESSSAVVTGDTGVKSLNAGTQTFNITVNPESGATRTYTIEVTRKGSSVNDLKSLSVEGYKINPDFRSDITEYTLSVGNEVSEITVNAEAVDSANARVTGTGKRPLATGLNDISVIVTAQDGTPKTYTIKVTRAKSSNNYLASLNITEGKYTPDFDKETTKYYITVPYEVTSLNINAIPEDQAASLSIDDNKDFTVGENKVTINVKAEDDTVRTYEIYVTRQDQANNYLTDITVTGDDGVKYPLSPKFNKDDQDYDVVISESVKNVNITVTKADESLQVSGDGSVAITTLPQQHEIVVSTAGGIKRTYRLNFVKGLSSNNKLKSLSIDKGVLDPRFDPDEIAYNVDLPAGTNQIQITAIKSEESQTITGIPSDGIVALKAGRNTIKVAVTAEDGSIRTYYIFVNVKSDNSSNELTSLIVDKGELKPAFDSKQKLYTVDLDETEDSITISATGNNKITGDGKKNLDVGVNVFEIVSTDNDGNENVYRVVVNRGSVASPSPNLIYLQVDGYNLNETFDKDTLNYTMNVYDDVNSLDVIAIPEDKNATVTITGNTNMVFGENIITISVTDQNSARKDYTIKVSVGNNKLASEIHTIGNTYIATIEEGEISQEVKNEMINPNSYLKIYDLDNNEISDTDPVGTGYIIKLEINGVVYDSKVLVIKGDLNSDGRVEVSDIIKLRMHILGNIILENAEFEAADANGDGDAGVSDLIKIRSHILGNLSLYERVGE